MKEIKKNTIIVHINIKKRRILFPNIYINIVSKKNIFIII